TQERETTELEPLKTDSDDSFFTKITSEMEFDTEQFRSDNQELYKELPLIAGDSKSGREEK
ncbi:hypothetical protein ACTXT7_016516, partial [Hymenolepis weldensis]